MAANDAGRVRVRDRQAQRIGGILAGLARQREQARHHRLDLRLGGQAVADHGLLHLQRGVLGHRQAAGHQRGQCRAARLAEQQRALRVDVDEHDLHRRGIGPVALHHLADAVEDQLQPQRQLAARRLQRADGAAGDVAQPRAFALDDGEAGALQAGVDAEDAVTSEAPSLWILPTVREAKPRAGMRRRSNAAALRCATGPLRCSVSWPVAKLASLTAFAALEQSRRVRRRSARCARAATSPALLGAAYVAADAHPPPALPAPPWHASSNTRAFSAVGGARGGRLVGRREAQQRGRRAQRAS